MNFLGPIRVAQEKASMRLSDAASYLDTKNISTGDIATGIGALFVLYWATAIIYRLTLHPLAKYPGPVLWAISPIPSIFYLLRGRISFQYKILHDKYGPVVRVMPNELAFNTAQAFEDIYGHRQGRPNMTRDPIHVGAVEAIPGASNLTMSDEANHPRQRRALAHAFSKKALMEQEDILLSYVKKFVTRLEEFAQQKKPVNMVSWYNYCTFDIIGDLSFGEPFGCLEEGEGGESATWVVLIYESIKSGAIEQATRRFATAGSLLQRFLLWLCPTIIRTRRLTHLRNSTEKTIRRMNTKTEHKDFLWYILRQREKKNEVSDDEVIMNAALFIVAGSETTATLLCGVTNLLLRNREILEKLKAEIRNHIKKEEDLTTTKLGELPYLDACLDEALRIFPPVPVGLLRVVPNQGSEIDGHFIPAGTSVCVSSWAASHSPANFIDPDKYIPERWMNAAYDSDTKKASQPFSLGPRGCIGRNLTYVELRLILGHFLWHFDIEFFDGAPLWNPANEYAGLRAYNTWEKSPLLISLTDIRKNSKE